MALQGASFDQLLTETANLTARGLRADYCKIFEYVPSENCFLVRAGEGWEPGIVGVATVGADNELASWLRIVHGKARHFQSSRK